MTKKFIIKMTRSTAVKYIAWEFGLHRAQKIISTLERIDAAFYRLPILDAMATPVGRRYLSRHQADVWANRVRQAVAYQQARLGQPLIGGDIYVVSR